MVGVVLNLAAPRDLAEPARFLFAPAKNDLYANQNHEGEQRGGASAAEESRQQRKRRQCKKIVPIQPFTSPTPLIISFMPTSLPLAGRY